MGETTRPYILPPVADSWAGPGNVEKQLTDEWTDGRTDRQTDKATSRVLCPRQKKDTWFISASELLFDKITRCQSKGFHADDDKKTNFDDDDDTGYEGDRLLAVLRQITNSH